MLTTLARVVFTSKFETVLLWLARPENKEQEFVFSSEVMDIICKENQYPCCQFAHTPEGDAFKRINLWNKRITIEYIVMKNKKTQDYDSYVHQISQNGKLIYRRPEKPIGKILVL